MTAARCTVAGGGVRQHRIDDGVTEFRGDTAGDMTSDEVVFAQHQMRPVLLGAAGINERGGGAGLYGITHFGPGQLFEMDTGQFARRLCDGVET